MPKGIANGQHQIAHLAFVAVRKSDGRQVMRVNLHHGNVRLRVVADDFGREHASVLQGHLHFVGVIHHMVIGQDVAVLGHDHTGADAAFGLLRNTSSAAAAKELAEERIVRQWFGIAPSLTAAF